MRGSLEAEIIIEIETLRITLQAIRISNPSTFFAVNLPSALVLRTCLSSPTATRESVNLSRSSSILVNTCLGVFRPCWAFKGRGNFNVVVVPPRNRAWTVICSVLSEVAFSINRATIRFRSQLCFKIMSHNTDKILKYVEKEE